MGAQGDLAGLAFSGKLAPGASLKTVQPNLTQTHWLRFLRVVLRVLSAPPVRLLRWRDLSVTRLGLIESNGKRPKNLTGLIATQPTSDRSALW